MDHSKYVSQALESINAGDPWWRTNDNICIQQLEKSLELHSEKQGTFGTRAEELTKETPHLKLMTDLVLLVGSAWQVSPVKCNHSSLRFTSSVMLRVATKLPMLFAWLPLMYRHTEEWSPHGLSLLRASQILILYV